MITEIGIVAGEIWHFLDEQKESTLGNLVTNLDKPRETILMSLGWLAREGHVRLEQNAQDFKIELRPQNK